MKNSAYENFSEEALEALDFARCQRPNGTFYGTSGQCRKGSPTDAKEKEAPKGRKSSGKVSDADAKKLSASLTKQIGDAAKAGDQKKVDNLMLAKSTVDQQIKARKEAKASGGASKATQANVRKLDKAAKAADKKADAADKKFQDAYKAARKLDISAGKDQAALRKDPQNQALKDKYRVSNMRARNARDSWQILKKQARKLDREAKALNRAANKLDKEFQKSIKK